MLLQARHDLDEIAGTVAVVELPLEDVVPRILAGAGRARQAEDVGALRQAGAGARLDRGGAHLLEGIMWKTVEKPSTSFSNSGFTASGVTSRPVKPVPPVVMTTSTAGSAIQPCTLALISGTSSLTIARAASSVPARLDHLAERVAGPVVGEPARVGHRQHGDAHGDEGAGFVDFRHARPSRVGTAPLSQDGRLPSPAGGTST